MNRVFIIGDIHADAAVVDVYADIVEPDPSDTLIFLGDFGGNFCQNYHDDIFKKKLGKHNFTYFVIRGNHDRRPSDCLMENKDKWHLEHYFGNYVYVEDEYPYIKYAIDSPAVYTIQGKKTLVLPGAYSVDKYTRLSNGWIWYENEQMDEKERTFCNYLINIRKKYDIVLSHTCPRSFEPTDLFFNGVDQSMVDKTMENYFEQIERSIDYKLWCFAHFHALRVYPENDGRQMIMLYNKQILNLRKYFEEMNPYDALIKGELVI